MEVHCCDWKKDETFKKTFRRFSQFLLHLDIDIIVFDGYNMLTKTRLIKNEEERNRKQSRSGKETRVLRTEALSSQTTPTKKIS